MPAGCGDHTCIRSAQAEEQEHCCQRHSNVPLAGLCHSCGLSFPWGGRLQLWSAKFRLCTGEQKGELLDMTALPPFPSTAADRTRFATVLRGRAAAISGAVACESMPASSDGRRACRLPEIAKPCRCCPPAAAAHPTCGRLRLLHGTCNRHNIYMPAQACSAVIKPCAAGYHLTSWYNVLIYITELAFSVDWMPSCCPQDQLTEPTQMKVLPSQCSA